jgi:hypothetical protein
LKDFFESNINRENLPESDTVKRVVWVSITPYDVDDNGKIINVRIRRGVNDLYDNEAIRIVKLIPEWEVLYRRGKRTGSDWMVPIIFDLTEK